jgi:hypothetical protein
MNKITLIGIVVLSISFFSGCAGSPPPPRVVANKPGTGEGVSFGVYDIAKSGPSFASLFEHAPSEPLYQRSAAISIPAQSREAQVDENVALAKTLGSNPSPSHIDRKIIRNAELTVESEDPPESQQKIAAIAQAQNGFVIESQQSNSDVDAVVNDNSQIVVRVPADRFTVAVAEIRSAGRVLSENIKGQDVTEEFVDIEARLKAKLALELQFMEIMKQADSVEDALSVQKELAEVRSEIEKIEGRKRFLESQSGYSTIRVRLQTPAMFTANSTGFGYRLSESFGNGLNVALNFTLGLVTFAVGVFPMAIFIGVPGFFIGRSFMRRRSRPLSIAEIAEVEIKPE